MHSSVTILCARLSTFASVMALAFSARAAETGHEFFEKHIRPVLIERCYECHSGKATKVKGGLLLDSREGMLKGGDSDPVIVPLDPENSLLIKAIRYHEKGMEMPPKAPLAKQILRGVREAVEPVARSA